MQVLDCLSKLIWPNSPSDVFLDQWRVLAEEVRVESGEAIIKQLHPAKYIYFIIDGEIEHSIAFEGSARDVLVGRISTPYFPLGWSGFSSPSRYATSARAKTPCLLYRWPIAELDSLLQAELVAGQSFYSYVLKTVMPIASDVRKQLSASPSSSEVLLEALAKRIPAATGANLKTRDVNEVFGRSLFFEAFPGSVHTRLADIVEMVHVQQGDAIFKQGELSGHMLILASGAVAVFANNTNDNAEMFVRSYSIPGQIVATAALSLTEIHEESATAITDVTLLSIKRSKIVELKLAQPQFGFALEKRMLWLLSARLRTLRIQLAAQGQDQEHIVIQNLLSQVSPQLGVSSKLYKLPHLLACRLTHADALACLKDVNLNGSRLERCLAGVCLDVLAELSRELDFYESLHDVYKAVTQAPLEKDPGYVRFLCSQGFKRVFEISRYALQGVEHLPEKGGNIFILNHLISHPYHALANGFEFSLDTHFVSAMILEPKYGESGIRVVRRGRGEEHAHHSYYDRLGHIYVYTAESDSLLESKEEVEARRESFTQTAGGYLRNGANLIVCPEGTSNWGENSPSAFKKGTFHLAAALDPEPLIVPISVANFDKRLKKNAFAAMVHKPFYISEVCDPTDKTDLTAFVSEFRSTYRGYVLETQALAQNLVSSE